MPIYVREPKVVGFTCGCFDLIHYGYILMFKECKKGCDHLVVGLARNQRPDKNQTLISSLRERMELLKAIRYVDDVIVYEGPHDLGPLIREIRPDIRFVGADYKDKPFDAQQDCADVGVKIVYNSRDHEYSTSDLKLKATKFVHGLRPDYEDFGL